MRCPKTRAAALAFQPLRHSRLTASRTASVSAAMLPIPPHLHIKFSSTFYTVRTAEAELTFSCKLTFLLNPHLCVEFLQPLNNII